MNGAGPGWTGYIRDRLNLIVSRWFGEHLSYDEGALKRSEVLDLFHRVGLLHHNSITTMGVTGRARLQTPLQAPEMAICNLAREMALIDL